MSTISCIIVEDEPLAAKVLQDYISGISFLNLKATFKDAIDATEFLRHDHVDLIFLDIHLPRLKGMDFLRTLQKVPQVIITTAYHQYALEGYELNVTDYLMKPIEFERFLQAVNKVKVKNPNSRDQDKKHLFLGIQNKKVKIQLADILYVESQREYVKVVTADGILMPKMTTKQMEALLPAEGFRRIHRSYIVALDKIDAYTSGALDIRGAKIPVGRNYKDSFERIVKRFHS